MWCSWRPSSSLAGALTLTVSAAIPQLGGTPSLEAVVFDAGLTLIQTATPATEVAAAVLGDQGVHFNDPDLAQAMRTAESFLEATWHRGDWWASEAMVRSLFVSAYRRGLPCIPSVGGDATLVNFLAEAIYDGYQDTRHWGLYPDVQPTLEALRSAGLRMGIISDWGHGLEAIVLELELHAYLEFLVVSSRIGISKPDPSVFAMALDRIGVAPDRAIYVGDTYIKDVLGARAAGLAPVLLDRSGHSVVHDCPVVADLRDLLPLVGATLAG